MFTPSPGVFRDRAVLILHRLVQGPKDCGDHGLPTSMYLPGSNLIDVAGDHNRALDPEALRRVAHERG